MDMRKKVRSYVNDRHISMSSLSPMALLFHVRRSLLRQQWFTSRLLPAIPRSLRWKLRKLFFLPSDLIDRMTGERDELVPPKSMIFTGAVDDYRNSGAALVRHLASFGVLQADSRVLDLGSGIGRLAGALIAHRGASGSYEGVDIVPAGVTWCSENITPKHPNHRFTLADIYNKEYNPDGRLKASDYELPFADDTFDLVVLASVFTHMLPADMRQYVAQIARVLREGGAVCASYYLLDDAVRSSMNAGRSASRFTRVGPHWVTDVKVPELLVAYEAADVGDLFEEHGMSCSIHHGSWSRRTDGPQQPPRFFQAGDDDYRYFDQDYVIATKGPRRDT